MFKSLFHKKFSLFLAFLVIFVVSFAFEVRYLQVSYEEPIPTFDIIDVNGGVELLDSNGGLSPIVPGFIDFKGGQTLITHGESDVLVEVNGVSYFRLGANSKLKLDALSFGTAKSGEILENATMYLESGRLWVNNVFNQIGYNIYTNKVLVIPGNSVLEMNYNGSRLYIYNHMHDLNIGLLAKPYSELKRGVGLKDVFYNYFFLPEGNRIDISESKISEKLATLLLSKLVKEFPIQVVLKDDLLKDEFYLKNLDYDNLYTDRYVNSYVEMLKSTVIFNRFSNLQQVFMENFERNKFPLIFSSEKASQSKEDFLSKIFDIAQIWSLNGDATLAEHNSDQFYAFWHSTLGYLNFDNRHYLLSELNDLQGVLQTNALYSGKKRIWNAAFDSLRSQNDYKGISSLLMGNLEEVYDLMHRTEYNIALIAFNDWSSRLDLFLSSYNKDDLMPYYNDVEVIRQNVTNLFARYSDFYDVDYFDTLTFVDQKLIELSPDKLEQEENRQTIIQDRIKILKRLSYLIQNNKIDRKKGIDLGKSMLANVTTVRNQALYRVAIYDYFDSELAEQSLLFEFYDSPEYLLLKGGFDEAFKAFQASRVDWEALQEYIKKVQPGRLKVKRIDGDKLIASVYEQFTSRKIYPESIGSLSDDQNRLFEIKNGNVGQNVFSGMFDNQTKLIYDLAVNGKKLSKGVHIDKLREVVNSIALVSDGIASERSDTADVVSEELADNVSYSSAEGLAITLAVNELSDLGFFVSKSDVEILDLLENRFYITGVELDEFPYTLSFEFDNTHDKLKKVVVEAVLPDDIAGFGTETKKIYLEGDFSTEGVNEKLNTAVGQLLEGGESAGPKLKVKVKRQ